METNYSYAFESGLRRICLLTQLFSILATPTMSYAEIPPEVKECVETATITEDGMLNGPNDYAAKLMDYMKGNWAMVLDNIGSIAPKESEKIVVMRAAESLSPQDYIRFLNHTRTMRLSGAIDEEVFERVLTPSRYKQGYLAVNYQNPAIQDFLRSIRSLVKPETRKIIDDEILSGKSKREFEEEWEANHENTAERNLLLTAASSLTGDRSETPHQNYPLTPAGKTKAYGHNTMSLRDEGVVEGGVAEKVIRRIWIIGLISGSIVVGLILCRKR